MDEAQREMERAAREGSRAYEDEDEDERNFDRRSVKAADRDLLEGAEAEAGVGVGAGAKDAVDGEGLGDLLGDGLMDSKGEVEVEKLVEFER